MVSVVTSGRRRTELAQGSPPAASCNAEAPRQRRIRLLLLAGAVLVFAVLLAWMKLTAVPDLAPAPPPGPESVAPPVPVQHPEPLPLA